MANSSFRLSILYSSTKSSRENCAPEDRLKNSRLLKKVGTSTPDVYELRPAVRDFMRFVDGFVFVVDATTTEEQSESIFLSQTLYQFEKKCLP